MSVCRFWYHLMVVIPCRMKHINSVFWGVEIGGDGERRKESNFQLGPDFARHFWLRTMVRNNRKGTQIKKACSGPGRKTVITPPHCTRGCTAAPPAPTRTVVLPRSPPPQTDRAVLSYRAVAEKLSPLRSTKERPNNRTLHFFNF